MYTTGSSKYIWKRLLFSIKHDRKRLLLLGIVWERKAAVDASYQEFQILVGVVTYQISTDGFVFLNKKKKHTSPENDVIRLKNLCTLPFFQIQILCALDGSENPEERQSESTIYKYI